MPYSLSNTKSYTLGVTWFILSLVISTLNDVLVKYLGLRLPFAEVAFFRFLFGILTLIPLIIFYGFTCLKTSKFSVHILRGSILFIAMSMWMCGINLVPLTTVTIMSFTIPMFVLILAPIFLKGKVSLQLWIATIMGFIGVYVVLNPHHTEFSIYSFALILAALMFASLDIINKKIIVQNNMIEMLFYSSLITTLLSTYPAYQVWVTPTYRELLFLCILGGGGNLILYFILKAFTLVNTSTLSPYRYLELIFSASLGIVLFHEIPHITTCIGYAIIIPANIYITYHQLNIKKNENTEINSKIA